MDVEPVIIIGAGPAGLAVAIQLKRYGVHALVFERAAMGGLLLNANLVENYPGFPGGIPGPTLVDLFIQQARHLGIEVTFEEILALDYDQGMYQARTEIKSYASRVAVIATGTKPATFADLPIPGNLESRIFYEVYPLLKMEGKSIAIIGSGDAAFDYGLNLSRKNQVFILNRGESPKCLPLLWERAQKTSAITYHAKTSVSQLDECPTNQILLNCHTPAGVIQLGVDYLVAAIGREPQVDCLSISLRQQTSNLAEQGVLYLIGDVANGMFRQTAIAVGDGVKAAMRIYRKLKENL